MENPNVVETACLVEELDGLVLVTCDGPTSINRYSYLATIKTRVGGALYRVLAMSDSIRLEAQNLLEIAQRQADEAAAIDAELFAAGHDLYESPAGLLANCEAAWANRRVTNLQWLAAGQSDFGKDGWVDVQDWRELLMHFECDLSIGSI